MRNIWRVPKRLFSNPERSEPTCNDLIMITIIIMIIIFIIIIIEVICIKNIIISCSWLDRFADDPCDSGHEADGCASEGRGGHPRHIGNPRWLRTRIKRSADKPYGWQIVRTTDYPRTNRTETNCTDWLALDKLYGRQIVQTALIRGGQIVQKTNCTDCISWCCC